MSTLSDKTSDVGESIGDLSIGEKDDKKATEVSIPWPPRNYYINLIESFFIFFINEFMTNAFSYNFI